MRAQCGNMFKDVFFTHDLMFSSQNPMGEIETMRRDVQDVADGARTFPPLRFISFKMTNYCNSDCVYCAHAVSRREEGKGQIPFPIIRGAIEDAARLGCTAIAINGGEPLLMPEIREIIRTMIENRIVPVLMTNGLLLPKKWEMLGEAGLRYLIISFDTLRKETYEKQRGASFEQALAGIDAACQMRERFGNVEIYISATLTQDNFDEIMELIRYTTQRGIKIQFSPFHNYLGDRDKGFQVDETHIRERIDQLIRMKKEGYLIGSSVGYMEHFKDYFTTGRPVPRGYVCKMGHCNVCIDANMNVKSCWSQRYRPAGNLAEQSLYDIWTGEAMKEYRERMLRGDCEGCWYMCTEITMLLDDRE